ncbi:MAG: response regulator [Ruminococcaceae bacterium]|nr:response regulator [Oscillospiraceae bacterium]
MNITELKVLICDDSILVRKKLTDVLKKAGITAISEAKDGVQAVDMYKEIKPDIVFMDIVMPVKTGLDALIEIREFDNNAKVVMASTIGTQSHLVSAIKAGAYEFLQKPVKEEDIQKVLNKIAEA